MLDLYNIPIDDEKTFELLGTGKTAGIFQLENISLGGRQCKHLQPKNIETIAAIIALIRPGALNSKLDDGKSVTDHFELRHTGQEESTPIIKELGDILKDTHDLMIFQEQTLLVARKLAGFDGSMAMKLQKGISKKKADIINELRPKFIEGCMKNGVSEKDATYLYDIIEKSNRYSFNLCISKYTRVLRFPNVDAPYTIEEMYKIRNDIRYAEKTGHSVLRRKWMRLKSYGWSFSLCEDGRIRKNIIKDIHYSGIQKLYRITLQNESFVEVTENHRFPTPNGLVATKDLSIGDDLYIRGKYEKTKKNYGYSDLTKMDLAAKKRPKHGIYGQDNYSYTNGSYSDFVKNKEILGQTCQLCGKTDCRIEVHHINGNRSNSKLENLQALCVSCHKKEEYKVGRTKIGEKGYPALLEKIKSIEYIGEDDVYDVEMAAPNHTFVTDSGIVTCNSHSVGYSYISYYDAYCKANFPIEFFVATLRITESFEDIRKLVKEAAQLGIRIKPPTIQKPCVTFTEFNEVIYFGFSNIKGIGDAKAQELIDTFKEPPTSWYSALCQMSGLGKTLTVNSIKAGVFSYLKVPRRKMLDDFSNIQLLSGKEMTFLKENWPKFDNFADLFRGIVGVAQTKRKSAVQSICQLIETPAETLEDNLEDSVKAEDEMLGVPLSYDIIDTINKLGNATIFEYKSGIFKKEFRIVAQINEVKVTTIKTGKNVGRNMAILKIQDQTGEMDAVVFSEAYDEIGGFLKQGLVHTFVGVRGKTLIVNEIEMKGGF